MNLIRKVQGFVIDPHEGAPKPFTSDSLGAKSEDGLVGGRGLDLDFPPKKVFRFLTYVVFTLTILSLITQVGHYTLGLRYVPFLVLDNENNIPSTYSGFTLAFCSVLLGVIAAYKSSLRDRFTRSWYGLSAIFLLLSLDEITGIHERVIDKTRAVLNTDGLLYFAWVIPGFALVVVFAIVYFKFWRSLPSHIRNLFLLSAVVFLSGALGMEMISGSVASSIGMENVTYALVTTAEEFLEMMGIVFFIYTLFLYIKTYIGPIKLNFRN